MTPESRARRRVRTPVLALAAAAWLPLVLDSGAHSAAHPSGRARAHDSGQIQGHDLGHDLGHIPAHVPGPGAAPDPSIGSGVVTSGSSAVAWLVAWLLMVVAMMGPALIPAIRHVAARSLPRRRAWSVVLLVGSYTLVWLVGGLLLTGTVTAMRAMLSGSSPVTPAAIALGMAMVWQVSPAKQRCLNHHMLLAAVPAFGLRNTMGTLRLGARQGLWCLGSCWALMLLPLLAESNQLVAMLAVALWIWAERLERQALPRWRVRVPLTAFRVISARVPASLGF